MSADYVFGDRRFYPSARGALRFEAYSFIGRMLSPRRRQPKHPLLQIGCGANPMDQFDNLDFYAMRFWRARHIGHDLRYPLPYADAVFEGAYSEHTLEHLPVGDAIKLLADVRRVLKPGSVFRVVVPSLQKYIDCYNGTQTDADFGIFGNGCEAIWSVTQNWGHLSCWNSQMLQHQLIKAGFTSTSEAQFNQGANAKLLCDQRFRQWESLYVEAIA